MDMHDRSLERILENLPPDLKDEVRNFAESLLEKHSLEAGVDDGVHPLTSLAGAWRDEQLTNDELLPERTLGRDVRL